MGLDLLFEKVISEYECCSVDVIERFNYFKSAHMSVCYGLNDNAQLW